MSEKNDRRRELALARQEYDAQAACGIEKLEREKEKLIAMLTSIGEEDGHSRNTLERTIAQLDQTMEQIRSVQRMIGRLVEPKKQGDKNGLRI